MTVLHICSEVKTNFLVQNGLEKSDAQKRIFIPAHKALTRRHTHIEGKTCFSPPCNRLMLLMCGVQYTPILLSVPIRTYWVSSTMGGQGRAGGPRCVTDFFGNTIWTKPSLRKYGQYTFSWSATDIVHFRRQDTKNGICRTVHGTHFMTTL